MTRWLPALLALLVVAPPAHAQGRLVHAFDADSEIQSTGNGFAWTTADDRVRVTDARGRTLYDVRPEARCSTPSATPGVALIECGSFDSAGRRLVWLLDTRSGALTSLSVPGDPGRIGGWWIESLKSPYDCNHCASLWFTNWHTGEDRGFGPLFDQPRRDVNDPQLGIAQRPYRRRGSRILVRRGDRWKQVAQCREQCGDIMVWRRRLAYVDGSRLVERRPRHTRSWRVPRALRSATLHRARNALVLQRGAEVWRAER